MYDGNCTITKWVDGDTFDFGNLVVGLFPHGDLTLRARCRPLGWDSPERGDPGYKEATAFAESTVPLDSQVTLHTVGIDFNGRVLAFVYVESYGKFMDELMLQFSMNQRRDARAQVNDLAERTVHNIDTVMSYYDNVRR